MTIKHLPLEAWMIRDHKVSEPLLGSETYPEIIPIIGQDGYFYCTGFCWIEINEAAFLADPVHWEHRFGMVCASELNKEQVDALRAIVKAKLASKQQKELLQHRINFEITRNIMRKMKLRVMQWRKSKS